MAGGLECRRQPVVSQPQPILYTDWIVTDRMFNICSRLAVNIQFAGIRR